MKARLFALFIIVAAAGAHAADGDARAAFGRGDFAAAARAQEAIVAATPSAAGYYNLGLALERAGDPTLALLNYERALMLDPGLRSARNARSKLSAAQKLPPPPPRSWVDDVTAFVHPQTLVVAGCVLAWGAAFAFLLVGRSVRRVGLRVLAGGVGMAGLAAVAAGWLSDPRLAGGTTALVAAKDGAEMLSSPANNSSAVMALPAGTTVHVLSPRGGWCYARFGDNVHGWLQTDRLMPVVPGETL